MNHPKSVSKLMGRFAKLYLNKKKFISFLSYCKIISLVWLTVLTVIDVSCLKSPTF